MLKKGTESCFFFAKKSDESATLTLKLGLLDVGGRNEVKPDDPQSKVAKSIS